MINDKEAINVVKVLQLEDGRLQLRHAVTHGSSAPYSFDFGWNNYSKSTAIEQGNLIKFTDGSGRTYRESQDVAIDSNSAGFADPYGGVLTVNLTTKKGTWTGSIKRKKTSAELNDPRYGVASEPYVLEPTQTAMECVLNSDPYIFLSGLGSYYH